MRYHHRITTQINQSHIRDWVRGSFRPHNFSHSLDLKWHHFTIIIIKQLQKFWNHKAVHMTLESVSFLTYGPGNYICKSNIFILPIEKKDILLEVWEEDWSNIEFIMIKTVIKMRYQGEYLNKQNLQDHKFVLFNHRNGRESTLCDSLPSIRLFHWACRRWGRKMKVTSFLNCFAFSLFNQIHTATRHKRRTNRPAEGCNSKN